MLRGSVPTGEGQAPRRHLPAGTCTKEGSEPRSDLRKRGWSVPGPLAEGGGGAHGQSAGHRGYSRVSKAEAERWAGETGPGQLAEKCQQPTIAPGLFTSAHELRPVITLLKTEVWVDIQWYVSFRCTAK